MKIAPVHVACPNCHFAVENRAEKCPRCGYLPITWPKETPIKPEARPPTPPTVPPRAPVTPEKKK